MENAAVLIVEDDPHIRQLLVEILREQYTVRATGCVAEALKALSSATTDLILADYLLPGGKLDRLLQAAETAGVPVVLTSGDPYQIFQHDEGK